MISYFTIGTDDFPAALKFYDLLMAEMGAAKVYATERNAGWGWGIGTPMFIVTMPFNKEPATAGNGTMIAFDASSPEQVDELHAKVLELGGTNEGDPGVRGEQRNMYIGYCRDLDGNKMNFIHYLATTPN